LFIYDFFPHPSPLQRRGSRAVSFVVNTNVVILIL
jgi:hypothetical protein